MKKFLPLYILLLICAPVFANYTYDEIKSDPNKAGGVYYAYPVYSRFDTPAPEGYKPFYISHIGRHGSRYLLKETDYTNPINSLRLAHKNGFLTPYGYSLYISLQKLYSLAKDRAGDLTEIGVNQHKQIAKRMMKACPEVFADSNEIVAHSTMVMRCAMSMAAFTESLKEENPQLRITREPSERHVKYLSHQSQEMKSYNDADGPWQKEYKAYRSAHAPYKTFLPKIFSDSVFVKDNINAVNFTCQMYNIAIDMQNLPVKVDIGDLFSVDELFELWKIYNFRMYAHYSDYYPSHGVVIKSSTPLLSDIIQRADSAIRYDRKGADLRFGHDINIIPLTALIGFDGCDNVVSSPEEVDCVFQDYRISPMASNIQIIFYKNQDDNIIVKFMLNEREIGIPCETDKYPFYDWEDAKSYLTERIEK